jgi:hypothetical protein
MTAAQTKGERYPATSAYRKRPGRQERFRDPVRPRCDLFWNNETLNTLAMMKGAPYCEAARRLAELVVSPQVEAALVQGPSAQIPLLNGSKKPAQVETSAMVHPMNVDFQEPRNSGIRPPSFSPRNSRSKPIRTQLRVGV